MVWAPVFLFVFLVLGSVDKGGQGEWLYRVYTNGLYGSLLLVSGALMMTKAEQGSFLVGLILGAVGLAVFFLLDKSVFIVLHF